jgi:small-conductance mechanosensitive channel
MKIINQKTVSTVFILIFTLMLGTASAVQTNETVLADDSVVKRSKESTQVSKETSKSHTKYLVEESVFHRFIKRGKGHLSLIGQRLSFVFTKYAEVPSELAKALDQLTGGRGPGYLAKIMLLFLLLIAVGIGAEKFFNITIQKHKQQLQSTIPNSFFQLIARLSGRTVLELFSFAVFALTIIVLYLLFYPTNSPLHQIAMVYLPPIFIIRLASIALNAVYSPKTPHLRIVPQNCLSAGTYLKGFMAFIIISLFTSKTLILLKSHGMNEGVFLLLYAHLGLVQFIILLTILWNDRARISRLVVKDQDASTSQSPSSAINIKRLWFPIACLGLFGFELLWQVNLIMYRKDLVLPLLLTILSIPFGFLLFSIGNRLLQIAAGQTELMDPRIVNQDILPKDADISAFVNVELPPEPVSAVYGDGSSGPNASLFNRNQPLLRKMMGILIGCALFFWVLNLWGLDLPLGRSIVQSAASIFATLLLAYVVWEICRTIIDRKLEEDRAQSGLDMEDMEEGAEGSRKGTLLTLLRKVIVALIGVIVVLITLNAVGINIGPLLAGAGILGLAIGFGSQTLVKDILSGVFFLMDDAFRVGDYIETAGTKGMVEHISLRSLRLRHPRGMVYTIPFGDMGSVQNFSRDYIITKLDVRVRYDADIDKIRKIVKKISQELEQDEETGQLLLSKIKSQGVREMDDSAMILRVKFKTKPGDQFVLRREVYRRIQERFRAEGIEFAHRNVTVYLPPEVTGAANGNNLEEDPGVSGRPDKRLIEAGAAAAIAASQAEASEKKPGN